LVTLWFLASGVQWICVFNFLSYFFLNTKCRRSIKMNKEMLLFLSAFMVWVIPITTFSVYSVLFITIGWIVAKVATVLRRAWKECTLS
jgi:hypothetical protein